MYYPRIPNASLEYSPVDGHPFSEVSPQLEAAAECGVETPKSNREAGVAASQFEQAEEKRH